MQDQMVLGYQIRKSSVSMPSNIAEGKAGTRPHTTFNISGPLTHPVLELETQLEIGARVEIIPLDQADVLIRDAQEVGRMLNGLIKSLDPVA